MVEFKYAPMFQLGEDTTEYYKIPGSENWSPSSLSMTVSSCSAGLTMSRLRRS